MPLRGIIRMLTNHPEVIHRLSESYPIKRAAQISVAIFNKVKDKGRQALENSQKTEKIEIQNPIDRFEQFFSRMMKNIQDEMDREKRRKK